MFWGCYLYNKKGLCHIWKDETPAEKREADKWIAIQNELLEPLCKAEQEIENGMRRLRIIRNMSGPKPKWKWTKTTGKLVRDSKGGIDWYRYYKCVLEKKLLPFAQECVIDRLNTIVQEDNASPYAHRYQFRVYNYWQVQRMLWPPNSPDLSAIEPPWMWMKKETTRHGASSSKAQMEHDWENCWEEMEQTRIQKWIERIPLYIQEVIKLEGGNEYDESKSRQKNPNRVHAQFYSVANNFSNISLKNAQVAKQITHVVAFLVSLAPTPASPMTLCRDLRTVPDLLPSQVYKNEHNNQALNIICSDS